MDKTSPTTNNPKGAEMIYTRNTNEETWTATTETAARKILGSNGGWTWQIALADMKRGLTVTFCGIVEFKIS